MRARHSRRQIRNSPDRSQLRELLARALALGGHRREAIIEADSSLKLRETTLDASVRPYVTSGARVLIQSGDYQHALDLLEPLISMNASDVTPAYLRIDPSFAPLRGMPRFEALLPARK